MKTTKPNKRGASRLVLLTVIGSMLIAACSSSADSLVESFTATTAAAGAVDNAVHPYGDGDMLEAPASVYATDGVDAETASAIRDGMAVFQTPYVSQIDAKVIRDGRIDVRIDEGSFDSKGAQLRAIAAELGGYISSGETQIEEYDENRYAVGWFTMKVPSDRFEDAVGRVEALGVRVSSSLSSQDVTAEYVDLEGRLDYWEQQEAFYSKLLAQATTIDDLVKLQVRMQDVLLNIEQIEGQLRYLDGRTAFATLTVGLTEVPDEIAPVVVDDPAPGPIAEAFDQAGEVLLATVAFLIVASAVALPLAMLVLIAWLVFRLLAPKKREQPVTEV